MSAADRLARLLALVPWLSSHPDVTVAEAAAHFGVEPAVLEKDLWLVVCCGLPGHGPDQLIDIDFWDEDGRIRVLDPQSLTRPVRLSRDEIAALLIGLRILAQVPGDHDRGALASVTSLLEDAAAESGYGVGDELGSGRSDLAVDPGIDGEARDVLDRALREGRPVRLRYVGATRDAISDRLVDPVRVHVRDGRGYLEAWCRTAEAHRSFRLDRIVAAEVDETAPAGQPRTSEAPTTQSASATGLSGDAQTMVVRVGPEGRWILDVHRMDVVEELPGGWCRASMAVADPAWGIRFILSLAGAAVLEQPTEWAEALRRGAEAGVERHA